MKLGPCQPQINRKVILLEWAFGLVLVPISPTLDKKIMAKKENTQLIK
jgi:hypothetical protein